MQTGYTELALKCYPGILKVIDDYADRNGLEATEAKNHAIHALGHVDALEQLGDVIFYTPAASQQIKVQAYWLGKKKIDLKCTRFLLEDYANNVSEEPQTAIFPLTDAARSTLNAYMRARNAPAEIALARGALVLLLLEDGDLTLKKGDEPLQQMAIEWGDEQ